MAPINILVVEDEELMRAILRELLESAGYWVLTADSAENAFEIYSSNDIAVTLTDVKMSGRDGLELLQQIRSIDNEAIVVIMTAYSSVDTAVVALRNGAYDYIAKPFVNADLLQTIKNAVEHRKLFQENRLLRREINKQYRFSGMIGKSDALLKVFDLVNKVAPTSANVLIEGETGTGKELIARSIHFNSERSDKPFLAINCGALPETLLESELFGHVKGSFTGAVNDQKGLLRSVAGGTLFLDEVAEMPPALQVKLLRALQEHEVTPVGSTTTIRFSARIIAATNKNLQAEMTAKRFREDLFFRLNVVEIQVPPLRERIGDIPLLAKFFASRSARSQNVPEKSIGDDVLSLLAGYGWPGNIRELENVIERAVILSGTEITAADIPQKLIRTNDVAEAEKERPLTLDEVEKQYVTTILAGAGNDKAETARILNIDLSTLYRKLKRYKLG